MVTHEDGISARCAVWSVVLAVPLWWGIYQVAHAIGIV